MAPSCLNLASIVGVGVFAAAASAQTPSFNLVGIASGNQESRAYGISADGSVACGTSYGGVVYPGFTWTAAGGRNDFGLQPGMPDFTDSFAISGDGTTVVGIGRATSGAQRAFRYRGPGTYQTLGVIPGPGFTRSEALSVSGDGSVLVGDCNQGSSSFFAEAFRWTESGGMQALGWTRPGHIQSKAQGVSRDGSTVVGYSSDAGGFSDAFVWTASGGMTTLPQLPGTPFPSSTATATNFDGSIVVGISGPNGEATLWRNGQPTGLGVPTGWNDSLAKAVSDNGAVVACSLSGTTLAAGVWTPHRGIESLSSYLTSNGVVIPAGWQLRDVGSVSPDGLSFAGWAVSSVNGQSQGFVATVPAPSAFVVALLGFAPVLLRRRRAAIRYTTSSKRLTDG